MWHLVSAKDHRIYNIINLLFDATNPITISTLAKETQSSIRTIKYELADLKKFIAVYDGELISSPEGIVMQLPSHIGMDVFQRSVYKSSVGLQLLELIFFNETYLSTDLEQLLFISSSSLNRLVTQLKQTLQPYKLSLEVNPFKITGDEALIRRFYSTYFKECCSISEWPFTNVNRKLVYGLLETGIGYYGYKPTSVNFFGLALSLAISIFRSLNGHSTAIKVDRPSAVKERQFNSFINALNPLLEEEHLSPDELTVYFDESSQWKYLLKLQNPIERKTAIPKEHPFQTAVEHLIQDLTYLFELPADSHDYLKAELTSSLDFYNNHRIGEILPPYLLFEPKDYGILEEFQTHYPVFYQIATEKIEGLVIDNGIPLSESLLANLMYILLSKWHLLTKHMHFKFYPCRLLLYSQFNTENAKNLAEEIQSEMGKDVTISIYDRSYIDLDSLADCDVDILITTSTLDLKLPYPVFYIYRKGFKLNTSKLNELTKQITDDKKIAYRVLIKERLSLLAEK